jgi:3-phenylpropionate/trans-cinnamate dioxygenase ferredoxin reductase subunit
VYLTNSTVIALDCVNTPRDFIQGKALVASAARPELLALENIQIPLKSLVGSGVSKPAALPPALCMTPAQ